MATLSTLTPEVASKYTLAANTLTESVCCDTSHVISKELGDAKTPEYFLPQIKLLRWDNETNVSIRLIHTESAPEIICEKDVIIWRGKEMTARFYDIDQYTNEFDVLLHTRPTQRDGIAFSLQHKGVNFYYQPPLTQDELDGGALRPDHVIGSYAIYHATKRDNHIGGKSYFTGKFGHIYRPQIYDADGKWIWGDLHIDPITNLLTIDIDRGFLDSARYPLLVDPTFGYNPASTPGTSQTAAVNYWIATNATTPADLASVQDLVASASMATGGATSSIKGIISSTADPSVIVANGVGGEGSLTSSQAWVTSTFGTDPTPTASTGHFLGIIFGTASAGTHRAWYDTGTVGARYETDNNYGTPTNPTSYNSTWTTRDYGIYCNYTATAGGGIPRRNPFARPFAGPFGGSL